jgi:uncharacterized protein (TIGR00369 family)
MDVTEIFEHMPFTDLLGIELVAAADGHAEATVEMREKLASVPGGGVAHGGVTSALADTVGGAAVMSLANGVTPTIDIRVDYLAPATDDLVAEATVIREGGNVAVTDIDIYDADDHHVATARGVYKTSGDSFDTPWLRGSGDDSTDDSRSESTDGKRESDDG